MHFSSPVTYHRCPEWLVFLELQNRFVLGGRDWSASISGDTPSSLQDLTHLRSENPQVASRFAANLPVPIDVYEALAHQDHCGLSWLTLAEYDKAIDPKGLPIGNVLLSLIYGQNYGTYMRTSGSNQIVSLRSGALQLIQCNDAGFQIIAETKTRGRSALAFAAHPMEPILAYGDNAGVVYLHELNATGFGKAQKVDDLKYKVSQIQFIDEGQGLLVGGMGYLNYYRKEKVKYQMLASLQTAVRSLQWSQSQRIVVVNQGMHGVLYASLDESGFRQLGHLKPSFPVNLVAVSKDLRRLVIAANHELQTVVYDVSFSDVAI